MTTIQDLRSSSHVQGIYQPAIAQNRSKNRLMQSERFIRSILILSKATFIIYNNNYNNYNSLVKTGVITARDGDNLQLGVEE